MMFSSVTTLASILAITSSVAATPIALQERGSNVIIGYRTVSAAGAAAYKSAGTLTATPANSAIGRQIGDGVYITATKGGWEGNQGDWTCVIMADSDAISRVSKAWIPQYYSGGELWNKNDATINDFIQDMESSWTPSKTLRMSVIKGSSPHVIQMAIPPALLGSGGAMGFTVNCDADASKIPDSSVDYTQWKNTKGSSQN